MQQPLRIHYLPLLAVASNLLGGAIFAVVVTQLAKESDAKFHIVAFSFAIFFWFVTALLMPRSEYEIDLVRQCLRFRRGPWIMPLLFSSELPIADIDRIQFEDTWGGERKKHRKWLADAIDKTGGRTSLYAYLMSPKRLKRICVQLAMALGVACIYVERDRNGELVKIETLVAPSTPRGLK